MAETIGSHSVASFTAPINGTSPIDANSVRNNDNTLRTAYVSHDGDPGIHVQSSDLSSRPAAGSAGRKWMTVDAGVARLWYDTGSVWIESTPSTKIAGAATVDLSAGTAVTLLTTSLANIAAGDVIEVTMNGALFNNSGGARGYTIVVTVGSYVTTIITIGSLSSATNRNIVSGRYIANVVSSSVVNSTFELWYANPTTKNTTVNGIISYNTFNDGSDNVTGTSTVTVTIQASSAGSNINLTNSVVQCRLVKAA